MATKRNLTFFVTNSRLKPTTTQRKRVFTDVFVSYKGIQIRNVACNAFALKFFDYLQLNQEKPSKDAPTKYYARKKKANAEYGGDLRDAGKIHLQKKKKNWKGKKKKPSKGALVCGCNGNE